MIAQLTDFGNDDNYAGVVKGVIKSISPASDIIDITHNVKPFSILNGQFLLSSSYSWFPEKTVFLVVVDPGVGTGRKCIIAATDKYFFVAPDNGLLTPVINEIRELFEIDKSLFPGASSTFHGRDIFAPVAAGLSAGKSPREYGSKINKIVEIIFPPYTLNSGYTDCSVMHIDRFGNIVTSVPGPALDIAGFRNIEASFHETGFSVRQVKTFGELDSITPGILTGSSGFIELCMNMQSLSGIKNISIDDRMRLIHE